MKTFEQLSEAEKARANSLCLNHLLKAVVEGQIAFTQSELSKKIKIAFDRAEQMRTPWFTHEYVMDTCRQELESIAKADAAAALYRDPGEVVLNLW